MDFDLSEEQQLLRGSARDFLTKECPSAFVKKMAADEKGYSPDVWRKMAELGWIGLTVPREYDGMGMDFLDLVILQEEIGRAGLQGPFFSTAILGGLTILETATEQQKKDLLPRLSAGKLMLAFALTEHDGSYDPASVSLKATRSDAGYVINGAKSFVENANTADYIITVARTRKGAKPEQGISLFLVDARSPGIKIDMLNTIAGDKLCEVEYDNVQVPAENLLGKPHGALPSIQKVLDKAAVAFCAQMVGAAQKVLETSVAYAKDRVQFGQPIGKFQAVQHHASNMAIDTDTSRFLTYGAAWKLSHGLPATMEVSMAKSWVTEAYPRISQLGQRILGGIGFCADHELPVYFKQAVTNEPFLGDAQYHREIVAHQLGM